MNYRESLVFATGGRSHFRIPSIIAANDGTLLAFCNDRKDTVADHAEETALVFARKTLDGEWSEVRTLSGVPGWACTIGSAVYDENTGEAFCFGRRIPVTMHEFRQYTQEEKRQAEALTKERVRSAGVREGDFLLCSRDSGQSWSERDVEIKPYLFSREDGTQLPVGGFCHGSAHGITLRHGAHAGRLLCPSRMATGEYHDMNGLRRFSYNNAVYSDDHGLSWKASAPVQAGTGEGTLMEDGEGIITYNSRAYYEDRRRYLATSRDGGESYGQFRCDEFLQDTASMGCNASLLRVERSDLTNTDLLPPEADSVTVFVNPRSENRDHLTACVSFDSGKTWPHTRLIHAGRSAYSSLVFDRKSQQFHLLYETGVNDPYDLGIRAAEFDLEWLLGTGEGERA